MKEKIIDFHYLGFSENLYLSTTGSVCACYIFKTPPIYSMSGNDYDVIYNVFNDAFSFLEDNITVHKQDIFIRKKYDNDLITGDTFLAQARKNRFSDTEYMEHYCFLTFSVNDFLSLETSYLSNPLKFKSDLHIRDKNRMNSFQKQIRIVVAKLNEIAGFDIVEASENEIKECIFNYYTLFGDGSIIRDFWTDEEYLSNGKKKVCGYALTDDSQLPREIELYSKARKFKSQVDSNENDPLKFLQTMFCEDLGITFHYTHVINQFWIFNKKYKPELEQNVSKAKRYRKFSKSIEKTAEDQEKLLSEITSKNNILCEYGFNLLIVEDEGHYMMAKEEIEDNLNTLLPKIYQPTGEGLHNLFYGSMIGFQDNLDKSFFFLTDVNTALCFNTFGSHQKGDNEGIIFNERNTNSPIFVDLWNQPFGRTISARNGIIISNTGGGKSVLALNIIRQHIEQGTKVIVLEIGKSFELLTKIYKDRAVHIRYNADSNIGINPFKLTGKSRVPDQNKMDEICELISRFLQQEDLAIDKSAQKRTIENLVKWYYGTCKANHSFDTFYETIENNKFILEENIDKEYFNIDRFLLVCKDFIEGGRYSKLSQEGDMSIFEKDLIVIELSDIKGNKFLFGYLMYILTLLIEKILMNRSIKSLFFIDEYGEIQDKKTSKDDDFNIHATTAYCYQKLRKEMSACYIGIQHAKQLKDDNFTQTILTQADLLFIPQTSIDIYKQIIEVFNITDSGIQNKLYSMNSNTKDPVLKNKYSEILVLVQKLYAEVVRICLSEEEFYCFQTDGKLWQDMIDELNTGLDIQEVVHNRMIE